LPSELCQRFLKIKKRFENKKTLKKRKNMTKIKNVKKVFISMLSSVVLQRSTVYSNWLRMGCE